MTRTNLRTLLLAVIGAASAFASMRHAWASELEKPSPRQGYYVSLSPHAGALMVWDKGNAQDVRVATGLGLRLGQMLTSRLGLGMMVFESSSSSNAKDTALFAGLFVLEGQYRVWSTLAISAGTGLGVVQVTEKNPINPDDKTEGAYGAYTTLGVSYDFFPYRKPLSGGFAISPALRFRFLPGSPLDALGVFAGVEFTWWTGLPKNQLDLPPDRAF